MGVLNGGPLSARICRIVIVVAAIGGSATVKAQSGAEANDWAKWCGQQGGHVQITSSNPVCIPGDTGNGSYSQQQQSMLNLAGQFGSALGNAIRQSIEESARRQKIVEMQQAWEQQQARREAAAALERQRQKNEALLAHMHDTIGNTELGRTQLATETLHLRKTDEMFTKPGNPRGTVTQEVPVNGVVDLAQMKAEQDAYFEAMEGVNDAEADVRAAQAEIETVRQLQSAIAADIAEQKSHLALLANDSPDRTAGEKELARLQALADEGAKLEADDTSELAKLEAVATEARAKLTAAAARPGVTMSTAEPTAPHP
jgi:hypothetical protein